MFVQAGKRDGGVQMGMHKGKVCMNDSSCLSGNFLIPGVELLDPPLTFESRQAWHVKAWGVVFSRRRIAHVRGPFPLGVSLSGASTLSSSNFFPCRNFIF